MKPSIFFLLLGVCLLYTSNLGAQQHKGISLQPEPEEILMQLRNSSQKSILAKKTYPVGEIVCFPLTAKDAAGNVIRSWDQTGSPVTLTLFNSNANTDTSNQSWNNDPEGFTFAKFYHEDKELAQISPNEWSIPPNIFKDGTTVICLIHTRADTSVYFSVDPKLAPLNQTSEVMDFTAGKTTNFLVDLTSSLPNKPAVYKFRKYEIVVTPRDKFLNPTDEEIHARFSARFPGEFNNAFPGTSNIFQGEVFVKGETNYFLASTIRRELPLDQTQWIMAYAANDQSIYGRSIDYEILDHAPSAFNLIYPPDRMVYYLPDTLTPHWSFRWETSTDPYVNIPISRFTQEIGNDIVKYSIHFVDSVSLTNAISFDSDKQGMANTFTVTPLQIYSIGRQLLTYDYKRQKIVWFVEATDGLYTTRNIPPVDTRPRPGFYLMIDHIIDNVVKLPATAKSATLYQNYPNPFNPATNIQFEIPDYSPVTLKVYDAIGSEVATLVDEQLEPGIYTTNFNASNIASGVYFYRLSIGDQTLTKSMVVTK